MAKKPGIKPEFIHPNAMHIYTDGSFRPPDAAACSYLIFSERTQHVKRLASNSFRGKTINQMELMAINLALDQPNTEYVIIYSDSAYAISCLTLWYKSWVKNDWMTPMGEPVKNKDLIVEILSKIEQKKYVKFVKVAAHTGDKFNTIVDHFASGLTKKMVEDPNYPDQEHIH